MAKDKFVDKSLDFLTTLDDWRSQTTEEQKQIATLIVQAIIRKERRVDISESLEVSTHLITRIAENNGVAQKGPFKRQNPMFVADPVVYDIDATPAPALIMYPENAKRFARKSREEDADDSMDDSEEVLEPDTNAKEGPDVKGYTNIDDNIFKVMPDFTETVAVMLLRDAGFKLDSITLYTTEGHNFSFKAKE